MCGIIGVIAASGGRVGIPREALLRARDRLAHRGPDDAGEWASEAAWFGHRRLAVIDPTPAGHQPFVHDRGVLVYNGELYNDAALRAELEQAGWQFRTACDTETVLGAMVTWGEKALPKFRGMFALAYNDRHRGETILARDALGIKPLYWTAWTHDGEARTAFASEIHALLALPGVEHAPDLVTASAYLTTIRTTLGERTLFRGVRVVRPGWLVRVRLDGRTEAGEWAMRRTTGEALSPEDAEAAVREGVSASVRAHLRADVPTCALLSGGLDSSIVCAIAAPALPALHTYCSGARDAGPDDDFTHAAAVARHLGTRHVEAPVTRSLFLERWPAMVEALGVPLSTPNEVAIHEVARTLRAEGKVVTLSGEGADELFGGYEHPLRQAMAFESARAAGHDDRGGGRFQLDDAAWMPLDAKPAVLQPYVWRSIEADAALVEEYDATFAACRGEAGADPLDAHLRFQRRVNLAGLLSRLDTATMLAGVEGRTPFADAEVARLADRLPLSVKFDRGRPGVEGTKVVLRRAFSGVLPEGVVRRAKASFPLPFRSWVDGMAEELRSSPLARELFTEAAIETVAARPGELWPLAWPMLNLALWGRRFA